MSISKNETLSIMKKKQSIKLIFSDEPDLFTARQNTQDTNKPETDTRNSHVITPSAVYLYNDALNFALSKIYN